MRPRLLDLYCAAGGAAVGYNRAGFDVTGVDNAPQPRYPFRFIQSDALEYLSSHCQEYDAVHASPPCQAYSALHCLPSNREKQYPDLVPSTRLALEQTSLPWVIENVPGSPLQGPIMLCGVSFGLRVYRHRLFESNVLLLAPSHQKHPVIIGSHRLRSRGQLGRYGENQHGYVTVAGDMFSRDMASRAMGIDWMIKRELAQAIPPAYTEFLGLQLIRYCEVAA